MSLFIDVTDIILYKAKRYVSVPLIAIETSQTKATHACWKL